MDNVNFWIYGGFFTHYKTKKLKRLAGDLGILALIRLWAYATNECPSGDLRGMDLGDVEAVADWDGEPGQFADALIKCAFIDQTEGGLALHNWELRQPWASKKEERSNAGRLARLAAILPEKYRELVAQGIKGLSVSEYYEITNNDKAERSTKRRLKTVDRILSNSQENINDDLSDAQADLNSTSSILKSDLTKDKSNVNVKVDAKIKTKVSSNKDTESSSSTKNARTEKHRAEADEADTQLTQVIELWNEHLGSRGFAKVPRANSKRRASFRARLAEDAERKSLEWWVEIMRMIYRSQFLQENKTSNWLTFDWILNESNLTKISEGKYDRANRVTPRSSYEEAAESDPDEILARMFAPYDDSAPKQVDAVDITNAEAAGGERCDG